MNALIVIGVIALFIVSFAPGIAGSIIARRAWKRHRWPELKLAFRAFMAGLLIFIVSSIAFPLAGWLVSGSYTVEVLRFMSVLVAIANGIATVAIAVALYRLARRSAIGIRSEFGAPTE